VFGVIFSTPLWHLEVVAMLWQHKPPKTPRRSSSNLALGRASLPSARARGLGCFGSPLRCTGT
jgi:hypothetical protein